MVRGQLVDVAHWVQLVGPLAESQNSTCFLGQVKVLNLHADYNTSPIRGDPVRILRAFLLGQDGGAAIGI